MTYVDSILEEVEQMTPKTGFNVCIFDDFGDVGEKLTVIGHFESMEEADDLVAEYDDDITLYIYGSEKAEEKQLDVSQQKPHNIPAYLKKAKRDYEKGIHSDNEEYEDLNYHAHEFEEGDRERVPAGEPDGGQWVGDGDTPQSKTTRDRTFDRQIDREQGYVDRLTERIAEYRKDLEKEQETGHTLRGIQLEMKVNKMEKTLREHQKSFDEAVANKENWSKIDVFEMSDDGPNTHKVGNKGFKNGVHRSKLGEWKIEFKGDRMDHLTNGTGYGDEDFDGTAVSPEQWDERFQGKTMIHSNITKNADESILELENEIMYLWNDVLSDKQREGVDVLKIYYTDNPKWKIRHGKKERTLGTHGGRKITGNGRGGNMLMTPSVLTINLTNTDTLDSVLNTVIHEMNHSRWSKNLKDDHEKINAFTEKVIAKGREGAITEYAESYWNDLDKVKKENEGKWEEEMEQIKNRLGKADWQTQAQYELSRDTDILKDIPNRKKNAQAYIRENIAKVERLIANETHSEYFGMIGAPSDDDYHTIDTVKLQEYSKLIKEGLYD